MKAAVVVGYNDIRIQDIPEPSCGPKDIKVEVAYCGICGSDIPRVLKGSCHSFPQVLGHEFSGRVVEVGANVNGFSIGDHVVGVPLVPCFKCDDCAKGDFSLCKHYSFVGSRQQGAMAEYVVIPAENAIKVDSNVPLNHAALTEPSTVALHGVLRHGFSPNDDEWVAVIGMGPIGLFTLEWCKLLGAKHIILVGRNKQRLSMSKKYGAAEVVSSLDSDCVNQIDSLTGKKGCAYVFDAVGSKETAVLALKIAANHGVVCMIGTPTSQMLFDVKEWELINRREIVLTGSWMSYSSPWPGNEWTKTLTCMKDGELIIGDEFIADTVPIDNVRDVFSRFEKDRASIKGRMMLQIRPHSNEL